MTARSSFVSQDIGGAQHQDSRRIVGDRQRAFENGSANGRPQREGDDYEY